MPLYASENDDPAAAFESAYAKMLDSLKANYANSQIFCCTPCTSIMSSKPSFHFPYTYGGESIERYIQVIREVTERKQCCLLDLYRYQIPYDSYDGAHPTADGMRTIAGLVIRAILDDYADAVFPNETPQRNYQIIDCHKEEHEFSTVESFGGEKITRCDNCGFIFELFDFISDPDFGIYCDWFFGVDSTVNLTLNLNRDKAVGRFPEIYQQLQREVKAPLVSLGIGDSELINNMELISLTSPYLYFGILSIADYCLDNDKDIVKIRISLTANYGAMSNCTMLVLCMCLHAIKPLNANVEIQLFGGKEVEPVVSTWKYVFEVLYPNAVFSLCKSTAALPSVPNKVWKLSDWKGKYDAIKESIINCGGSFRYDFMPEIDDWCGGDLVIHGLILDPLLEHFHSTVNKLLNHVGKGFLTLNDRIDGRRCADNLINQLNQEAFEKLFFGLSSDEAANLLISLSHTVFHSVKEDKIEICFHIYINCWLFCREGIDRVDRLPGYIRKKLLHLFPGVPRRRLIGCVKLSLGHIYQNDGSLLDEPNIATKVILDSTYRRLSKKNAKLQDLYLHDPEYGIDSKKPIYVRGTGNIEEYLSHLYTSDGIKLSYQELDSLQIDEIAGPVKKYDLILPDRGICTEIYICGYGTRSTWDAPSGLIGKENPDVAFVKECVKPLF